MWHREPKPLWLFLGTVTALALIFGLVVVMSAVAFIFMRSCAQLFGWY